MRNIINIKKKWLTVYLYSDNWSLIASKLFNNLIMITKNN
jgi:hypothetical protein